MASNSFGKNLRITTFGESHGRAMGVIIDGCPAGLEISPEYIQNIMQERSSQGNPYTTPRKEADKVEILSGIYKGKTLGTPITLMVINENTKSEDYDNLTQTFRPSHADYTWYNKFNHRDHRGGGRSSARETVSRVAAASIAYKILEKFDIKIYGFLSSIYNASISSVDYNYIKQNPFFSPDPQIIPKWENILKQTVAEGNSVGGTIDIHIKSCPIGLGNPVFDKLNAKLAHGIFSIPAVKGVEFGEGFNITKMKGSEANDSMYVENGKVKFTSNRNGGTLGGISNGEDIIIKIAMKPTSSIALPQNTVNSQLENTTIEIKGRHDPCVAIRGVSVVKAMCALVISDFLLEPDDNF
ncbi:MAG: chorismate synthase [Alphaproteobacteria bacterium]|jgi:chorismate synthase|nr:chorismate synthase [Alphaproteobacteria bacterium]